MRIEGVDRFHGEPAIRAEVRNGKGEFEAGRSIRSLRISLFRPVREGVGKAVVPALLDLIEFVGSVGVRTVFGGEHFAPVIPAEAVGVAHAARVDFQGGLFGLRIDAPDAGGDGRLAATIIQVAAGRPPSVRAPLPA
jgi:hypothetical protein